MSAPDSHNTPPRFAKKLLGSLLPRRNSRSILGDFEEIYREMYYSHGQLRARLWYWTHIMLSVPGALLNSMYWSGAMLRNYLKILLRSIQKNKVYSFINIMGLAVGMAIALMVMLWVQRELSFDRFHEKADRLFRVAFSTDKRILYAESFHGEYLPGLAAQYLQEEYPEIEAGTIIGGTGLKLTRDANNFLCSGFFVHPEFFTMFSFPFIHGDPKTAFENPMSIVITESTAERLFGTTDVIGEAVHANDRVAIQVTGVVKDVPRNSHIQFEFLLPFELAPPYMKQWDNKAPLVYVLLKENVDWREVSKKIINVYNDHNPGAYPNYFYLQPMTEVRLHALGGGGRIVYLYIFSALACAILVLACINFMNLSTARSAVRFKEIGIKKVVGTRRGQLIRQFIGESLMLSCFALAIALLIAQITLPVINALMHEQIKLHFSGAVILGITGIVLFTGLLSGSYPAFFLSSFKPVHVLKGESATVGRGGNASLRRILVIVQFVCSVAFLIGVFVIYTQLNYFRTKDLGFDKKNILVLNLSGEAYANGQVIKSEIKQNANVAGATFMESTPAGWNSSAGISWPGKREDQIFDVGKNAVDYDYLETFKLIMAEGRFFSREYPSDVTDACILNEIAVDVMELENPVGKRVVWCPDTPYEREATIIGVVKNYHTESLRGAIRPHILFCTEQTGLLGINISPGKVGGTIEQIRESLKEISPMYSLNYFFLEDQLNSLYQEELLTGVFVTYIAAIAVFIACLGLFGLAAFSAERRLKEIGIRKVLGASLRDIVSLLSKEFLLLIILSNVIAWPIAYYLMKRWLQNFAFHTPLTLWQFVAAGAIIIIITLFTVGTQAIRAAHHNPVDSLKYE